MCTDHTVRCNVGLEIIGYVPLCPTMPVCAKQKLNRVEGKGKDEMGRGSKSGIGTRGIGGERKRKQWKEEI